jgi:hypothetical protein
MSECRVREAGLRTGLIALVYVQSQACFQSKLYLEWKEVLGIRRPTSFSEGAERFVGYFEDLLDVLPPSSMIDPNRQSSHQYQPSTVSEIQKVLLSMISGKSAGICDISAELLKAGGETVLQELAAVFRKIWKTCEIPAHCL